MSSLETNAVKYSRVSVIDMFVDVTVNEDDMVDLVYPPYETPHPSGLTDRKPYPSSGIWVGPRDGNVTITPTENLQDKKIGNKIYGKVIVSDMVTVSTNLRYVQSSSVMKLLRQTGIKTNQSCKFGGAAEVEYHNLFIMIENRLRNPDGTAIQGFLECWLLYKGWLTKPPIILGEKKLDDSVNFTFNSLYGDDPDNPGCLRDDGTATGHVWYQDWFSSDLLDPDSINFRL